MVKDKQGQPTRSDECVKRLTIQMRWILCLNHKEHGVWAEEDGRKHESLHRVV